MKGFNQVWISGNIGGKLVSGTTKDSNPCCSFSIATGDGSRGTTWVRINAYGPLAIKCQSMAKKGAYLSVVGELMNRNGRCGELTEVRACDVIFHPFNEPKEGEHNEREEGTKADMSVWESQHDAD